MRSSTSEVVTIGATIAFSSIRLLLPLADLRRMYPSVDIRVVSHDGKFLLESGEVDIAIRFGTPPFGDGTVIASKGDIMFPVCTPGYAKVHDLTSFPQWAARPDRDRRSESVSLDGFVQPRRRQGRRRKAGSPLHFTDTVAAARAEQGIAIGWKMLIENHLRDGNLIRVGNIQIEPEGFLSRARPL
jgi:DNA-binding transcriptional LysR family regulator